MTEFTKEQLKKIVSDAYTEYRDTTREFRNQAQIVRNLKKVLDFNKADAYYNGAITGKNQVERDAAEYAMFQPQLSEIEEEERHEQKLYLEKELAEIEVEYVRALLRIEELTQEI